jgi:hypothetical protein
VVYSLFFIPPKNLGDPGSSRGTLEHIRVDLTAYLIIFCKQMIVYDLFVHKKSVSKRKVCFIFIKNLKI